MVFNESPNVMKQTLQHLTMLLGTSLLLLSDYCDAAASRFTGVRLSRPTHELVITNHGTDTNENQPLSDLTYGTWDPVMAGVFINFGHFTLGLSSALQDEGEEATSTQEFRGSYWHKHFGFTAGFAHQENFQIIDGTNFDALENADKFRTDMAYQSGTVQLTYVLVEFGLHLANALEPAEYPKRTGGGIVTILSIDQMTIAATGPIIPGSQKSGFLDDGGFSEGKFISVNASVGYAQAIALGNFYMAGMFALGVGRANYTFEVDGEEIHQSTPSHKDILMLSAGYSGSTIFISAEMSSEAPEYILRSISLQSSRQELSISTGIRF